MKAASDAGDGQDGPVLVVTAHADPSARRPYNPDHLAAARMTLQARALAQAARYDAPGEPLGAPPVFLFEPHQPEQRDFKPQVLLDITEVCAVKRRAMEALVGQQHMWEYYTALARRRGDGCGGTRGQTSASHTTQWPRRTCASIPR